MAYPQLRSMNESLDQGAVDGKYKQIRRDTVAQPGDTEATLAARRQLHLAYYGVGEARMADIPGGRGYKTMPFFVPNKFEIEEEGPTFGKTW